MLALSLLPMDARAASAKATPPSPAVNPAADLKSVEQGIARSRAKTDDLRRKQQQNAADMAKLRDHAIAAARIEQQNEAALAKLQDQLGALETRKAHVQAELNLRRVHQADIVSALQRVALLPPEALVFSSRPPVDSERTGVLLGAVVPLLRRETQSLSDNLAELETLKRNTEEKRRQIASKQDAIHVSRGHLDILIQQRQTLDATTRQAATAEEARIVVLSARASDLRDLMQKLEQEQRERDARAQEAAARLEARRSHNAPRAVVLHPPPADAPAIRLVKPTAGRAVKLFGQGDDFSTAKGETFATAPNARIVAPVSGKIMFAGPFKGYGQILIIDHSGGYHCLLAGLDRIQSAVGQSISAGEPIGTMRGGDASPELYLELRWQGQPIDPMPTLDKSD